MGKNLKKISSNIFNYCLLGFLISCNQDLNFIPLKHETMQKDRYDYYVNELKQAYEDKNNYRIAFQLSNLKYKGSLTYFFLHKAIENDSNTCNTIFETVMDGRQHHFHKNIFKNDTVTYVKAFNLCLTKHGPKSYEKYVDDFIERSNLYTSSCYGTLDTSLMDPKLNSFLERMLYDDQKYRKLSTNLKLTVAEQKKYDNLILKIDSINLFKLDSLFSKRGFPGFDKISPKLHKTVFLILHHQSDTKTRLKYRHIIEKNYPKNLLDLYDKYTANKNI